MIHLKQGDTGVGLSVTLSNKGTPVDLTNTDVLFYMGAFILYPVVTDAVNGKLLVTFDAIHTETTGLYKAEVKVTFDDGRVETYPNNGYETIQIQRSIGGV